MSIRAIDVFIDHEMYIPLYLDKKYLKDDKQRIVTHVLNKMGSREKYTKDVKGLNRVIQKFNIDLDEEFNELEIINNGSTYSHCRKGIDIFLKQLNTGVDDNLEVIKKRKTYRRCEAEKEIMKKFKRQYYLNDYRGVDDDARLSLKYLEKKMVFDTSDISDEVYSALFDKIIDIMMQNVMLRRVNRDLYINDIVRNIEKRRLDNIRVVFTQTTLTNDCVSRILEYACNTYIPKCTTDFSDRGVELLVDRKYAYLRKIDEYTTDGVMEEKRLKYKNCWTLDDIFNVNKVRGFIIDVGR
jgi:hypothetical protein